MAVIGTAGHVDHGKSALVERLTGIDPDRFDEEKRRGLTIDLGFAWLTLPSGREVGMVDVPGHERFVRNMLAGAGGISACLFVVAANEGWKPQSAEHLAIVDTLGIEHGVVALTKADLVDEARLDEMSLDIAHRLETTSLSDSPIVPCSAVTGDGLKDLLRALDAALDRADDPTDEGRPRLWVDRVFTIKGAGTVVTGTLAGGALNEGEEVVLAPDDIRARVRSVQTHKKKVSSVPPANRVALNLVGLERAQAERGDAIVRAGQWHPTRTIDAVVRVLPEWATGGQEHELTARGSHLLYVGSAEVPVRVRLLEGNRLRAGERGFARLKLRDPLPVGRGDRFVLRDAGRVLTFGGGEVLDPQPKEANVDLLRALDGASPADALLAIVDAEGIVDASEALLRARTDGESGVERVGPNFVSATKVQELTRRLTDVLREHHARNPLEVGMSRGRARSEVRLDGETFDGLVRRAGVIDDGTTLRLPEHRIALTTEQQRDRDELFARLDDSGFTPPLASELAIDAALLKSLVDTGELIRIENFYLTRTRADEARKVVGELIEGNGPATVAQIRDALGTTRKYAVPLCEWLDATGVTVRRGDVRALGPNA